MKKSVIAISAAVVLIIASTASAQESPAAAAPVAASSVVVDGAAFAPSVRYVQPRRQVRSSRNGGVLSRLIELERRKNAWLMRTFLGR